jgi:hypothetical protein
VAAGRAHASRFKGLADLDQRRHSGPLNISDDGAHVALALAEYLDRAALAATTVSTAIGLPSFTPLALAAS